MASGWYDGLGYDVAPIRIAPATTHAHPNNPPPSSLSSGDLDNTACLGHAIVAVDNDYNADCSDRGRR